VTFRCGEFVRINSHRKSEEGLSGNRKNYKPVTQVKTLKYPKQKQEPKRSIRIPPQVDHVSGQVNHKPFSLSSSSPPPLLSPLSSSFYSLPTILNPTK